MFRLSIHTPFTGYQDFENDSLSYLVSTTRTILVESTAPSYTNSLDKHYTDARDLETEIIKANTEGDVSRVTSLEERLTDLQVASATRHFDSEVMSKVDSWTYATEPRLTIECGEATIVFEYDESKDIVNEFMHEFTDVLNSTIPLNLGK